MDLSWYSWYEYHACKISKIWWIRIAKLLGNIMYIYAILEVHVFGNLVYFCAFVLWCDVGGEGLDASFWFLSMYSCMATYVACPWSSNLSFN